MAEDSYTFTPEGLDMALDMHNKAVDGWTLQSIADYYDFPNEIYIRIILIGLYQIADQVDVDLTEIPDDLRNLVD